MNTTRPSRPRRGAPRWERIFSLGPGRWRGRFKRAEPFGHLVLDGFAGAAASRRLAAELPRPEAMLPGGARRLYWRDVRSLGPSFTALDAFLSSGRFLRWLGAVTENPDIIRNPARSCGGLFYDQRGMELAPHIDVNCTVPGRRRAASVMLYLNSKWLSPWGGALELSDSPLAAPREAILPVLDRCVVMASHEASWHGYRAIRTPRRGPDGRWVFIVNYYRPLLKADAPAHRNVSVPGALLARHAARAVS